MEYGANPRTEDFGGIWTLVPVQRPGQWNDLRYGDTRNAHSPLVGFDLASRISPVGLLEQASPES